LKISRDSTLSLLVFLVMLIACTAVGYWLIFRLGRATPIMMAVGVATILTCLVRKRKLASLGWHWGAWKYQWVSYLLPLLSWSRPSRAIEVTYFVGRVCQNSRQSGQHPLISGIDPRDIGDPEYLNQINRKLARKPYEY
jgi:hypothetical protein